MSAARAFNTPVLGERADDGFYREVDLYLRMGVTLKVSPVKTMVSRIAFRTRLAFSFCRRTLDASHQLDGRANR